jgi:hypothetical protein
MWAIDHLDPPNTMEVVAIPEGKRDPRCAIKYKTMPSTTLLQMVGAQI